MKTATLSVGNERGFTLAELLLVVVIIILLAAAAPPFQPGMVDNARFRKTQQEIIAGLRYSRSKAINSQQAVTLAINKADSSMSIAGENHELHLPDDVTLTMNTAPSGQLSENESAIRFHPDGSSTGLELVFRQGERVSRISVDGLTGRVSSSDE